jgi:hypothetical protein
MSSPKVNPPGIKRTVQRGSFMASDEAGRMRFIHTSVPVLNIGDTLDPDREIEGPSQFKTREGQIVANLDGRHFKIVETGEILTTRTKVID